MEELAVTASRRDDLHDPAHAEPAHAEPAMADLLNQDPKGDLPCSIDLTLARSDAGSGEAGIRIPRRSLGSGMAWKKLLRSRSFSATGDWA